MTQNTSTTPSKAVGHIITWQSATTTLGALRAALIAASLDDKLARDLNDYSKLARTARSIAHGKHDGSRRIARPIVGKRARQLTREVEQTDALTYSREAMLKIEGGKIACDAPELATLAATRFDAATDTRTASDVTRLIKRIVEDAGSDLMPLRDQGGVYFVPSGHRVVEQLSTVLSHVGGSLRKFAVTIGDGSEQSIANVVSDYLLAEIGALQASVGELDQDARSDVKARRVERLAELRGKLAAYATLLTMGATRVQEALDVADRTIVEKLMVSTTPTV